MVRCNASKILQEHSIKDVSGELPQTSRSEQGYVFELAVDTFTNSCSETGGWNFIWIWFQNVGVL